MVDVFLKLEAIGEWKLYLIALIAHYIVILQPLGCINLSLKILSGNVSHRHICVFNNVMQPDMSAMSISWSVFRSQD